MRCAEPIMDATVRTAVERGKFGLSGAPAPPLRSSRGALQLQPLESWSGPPMILIRPRVGYIKLESFAENSGAHKKKWQILGLPRPCQAGRTKTRKCMLG